MLCWKLGEQGWLCVSCGLWIISDLQKILCVDSHTITAACTSHPLSEHASLRQQHTSVFWYQARCWDSASTGKGKESPRSRDRLCSAFALCDTGPWSMIKVPGYYGDMNINDPVTKTPLQELYLHLIQDCPFSPTQPLSNGFIFMGFSFLFVK